MLCRAPRALGKGPLALSKAFAEGRTRQRPVGKKFIGKDVFAEGHFSGTRQRLCRGLSWHSAKKSGRHEPSTLTEILPNAALGKEIIFKIVNLCRVPALGKEIHFYLILALC